VAEAAKNALGMDNIYERVFIVKLLTDKKTATACAGRWVSACVSTRPTSSNAKPWSSPAAVWSTSSGPGRWVKARVVPGTRMECWIHLCHAAEIGAKMVLMENRFVPARFKDGYGPVGAWFLFFKAQAPTPMAKTTWPKTGPGQERVPRLRRCSGHLSS